MDRPGVTGAKEHSVIHTGANRRGWRGGLGEGCDLQGRALCWKWSTREKRNMGEEDRKQAGIHWAHLQFHPQRLSESNGCYLSLSASPTDYPPLASSTETTWEGHSVTELTTGWVSAHWALGSKESLRGHFAPKVSLDKLKTFSIPILCL